MAALAATLLAIVAVFAFRTTPGPGPLYTGNAQTEAGGSWDIGAVVSFGSPVVRNPTDDDIAVDEITLRPASGKPGATVTAVYVLDLTGITEKSGLATGFPPANQAHHRFTPANGATLKPNTTYQIVFVVRVDRPGRWSFPSFEVEYRIGDQRHLAKAAQGLMVCAPKETACSA